MKHSDKLAPFRFSKGVSGNPKGMPPGTPQHPPVPDCLIPTRKWTRKDWDAFYAAALAKHCGDTYTALHDVFELWSFTRRRKTQRSCLQCLRHVLAQVDKR